MGPQMVEQWIEVLKVAALVVVGVCVCILFFVITDVLVSARVLPEPPRSEKKKVNNAVVPFT